MGTSIKILTMNDDDGYLELNEFPRIRMAMAMAVVPAAAAVPVAAGKGVPQPVKGAEFWAGDKGKGRVGTFVKKLTMREISGSRMGALKTAWNSRLCSRLVFF